MLAGRGTRLPAAPAPDRGSGLVHRPRYNELRTGHRRASMTWRPRHSVPTEPTARCRPKDVVSEIAEDLFSDCGISGYGPYRDELWASKYVFMTYAPSSRGKMSSHWEGDGGIALPAEYVRLREDVERLRAESLALLLDRDELVHVVCRNIEMRYMLTLGGLEYKVYELRCAVLRLKRKIEMIQARRNRQEKIVLSEIESALNGTA